jgi:hypothetical protein
MIRVSVNDRPSVLAENQEASGNESLFGNERL